MINKFSLLFFQPSHQDEPGPTPWDSVDKHPVRWLLGNSAHSQRQPQVLPSTLHPLLPPQLHPSWSASLGLPPAECSSSCTGDHTLHYLQSPSAGWRTLESSCWPSFCIPPGSHWSGRWCCWAGRCRCCPVFLAVSSLLYETLWISQKRVISEQKMWWLLWHSFLGLDAEQSLVRSSQYAVEGAGSDGAGCVSCVRPFRVPEAPVSTGASSLARKGELTDSEKGCGTRRLLIWLCYSSSFLLFLWVKPPPRQLLTLPVWWI